MPGLLQPERRTYFHLDGMCDVSVKSLFSGKWHMQRLRISEGQWESWQRGAYIHLAMPHLTADQREFLMSGATSEEWEEMCKEED